MIKTDINQEDKMDTMIDELLELSTSDLVDLAWDAYKDTGVSKAILLGEPRINLMQAALAAFQQ